MFSSTFPSQPFYELLNEFKARLSSQDYAHIEAYWLNNALLRAWYQGGTVNMGTRQQPRWETLSFEGLVDDSVQVLKAGAGEVYEALQCSNIIKKGNVDYAATVNQTLAELGLPNVNKIMTAYYRSHFTAAFHDNSEQAKKKILRILKNHPNILFIYAEEMNAAERISLFSLLLIRLPNVARKLLNNDEFLGAAIQHLKLSRLAQLLITFSHSQLVRDESVLNAMLSMLPQGDLTYLKNLYDEMDRKNGFMENIVMRRILYLTKAPMMNEYIAKFESALQQHDYEEINAILEDVPLFLTEYVRRTYLDDEKKHNIFQVLLLSDAETWLLNEFLEAGEINAKSFACYIINSNMSDKHKVACFCNLLVANLIEIVKAMIGDPCFLQFLSDLDNKSILEVFYDLAKSKAASCKEVLHPMLDILSTKDYIAVHSIFSGLKSMRSADDNLVVKAVNLLLKRMQPAKDSVIENTGSLLAKK